MNRRQFLAGAGVLAAATVAGCVETEGSSGGYVPTTPDAPESVSKWTFDTKEAESEEGVRAKPSIECQSRRTTVKITGKMYSGSDCQMLGVTSLSHDVEAFHFGVGIYEGKETNCSDGVDIETYEGVFKFSDEMPTTVVATEALEDPRRAEKRCG